MRVLRQKSVLQYGVLFILGQRHGMVVDRFKFICIPVNPALEIRTTSLNIDAEWNVSFGQNGLLSRHILLLGQSAKPIAN